MNLKKKILDKIKKKNIKIAIIGLGYIGLPLSIAFASTNIKTFGYDINKSRGRLLLKKKSYINTINNKLLEKYINYNFTPSSNFENIYNQDIIIICVPTPLKINNKPNLIYLSNVIQKIKNFLHEGQTIILECTSYPGTTKDFFLPALKKKKFNIGKNFFLGYSPEREDPGNKKYSVIKKNIPKVVSGYTENCLEIVEKTYKIICNKTYSLSDINTAEFSKLLENIYRSVNIGLINELAEVCKKMNIDIFEAINAAKTKPYGFQVFYPGPGVGGHCIPVDPFYLAWKAKQLGIKTKFIYLAGKTNQNRPILLLKKISQIIRKKKIDRKKLKILFLGISYKKDSDDVRNSPALLIYKKLIVNYKNITVCDPFVNFKMFEQLKNIKTVNVSNLSKKSNKQNFDFILILNNHSKFNIKEIIKKGKTIIDLANACKGLKDKAIIRL